MHISDRERSGAELCNKKYNVSHRCAFTFSRVYIKKSKKSQEKLIFNIFYVTQYIQNNIMLTGNQCKFIAIFYILFSLQVFEVRVYFTLTAHCNWYSVTSRTQQQHVLVIPAWDMQVWEDTFLTIPIGYYWKRWEIGGAGRCERGLSIFLNPFFWRLWIFHIQACLSINLVILFKNY